MSKKMWNKIFKSKSAKNKQVISENKRCSIYEEYQQLNPSLVICDPKNDIKTKKSKSSKANPIKDSSSKDASLQDSNSFLHSKSKENELEQLPHSQQEQLPLQPQTKSTFAKVVNTLSMRRKDPKQILDNLNQLQHEGNGNKNSNGISTATKATTSTVATPLPTIRSNSLCKNHSSESNVVTVDEKLLKNAINISEKANSNLLTFKSKSATGTAFATTLSSSSLSSCLLFKENSFSASLSPSVSTNLKRPKSQVLIVVNKIVCMPSLSNSTDYIFNDDNRNKNPDFSSATAKVTATAIATETPLKLATKEILVNSAENSATSFDRTQSCMTLIQNNINKSDNNNNLTNKKSDNLYTMASVEADDAPPCLDLIPCSICSRTFNPVTLKKHINICEKMARKKRKVFDSKRQRYEGTDLATYNVPKILKTPDVTPVPEQPTRSNSKPQLKKQTSMASTSTGTGSKVEAKHQQEEMAAPTPKSASSTRVMTSKGGKASETSNGHSTSSTAVAASTHEKPKPEKPVKRSLQPPTEQCPHCERCFGLKAYDRHVEWCKEKTLQVGKKTNDNQKAKERLVARTKYKAPNLKTKRSINREKYSGVETEECDDGTTSARATGKEDIMSLSVASEGSFILEQESEVYVADNQIDSDVVDDTVEESQYKEIEMEKNVINLEKKVKCQPPGKDVEVEPTKLREKNSRNSKHKGGKQMVFTKTDGAGDSNSEMYLNYQKVKEENRKETVLVHSAKNSNRVKESYHEIYRNEEINSYGKQNCDGGSSQCYQDHLAIVDEDCEMSSSLPRYDFNIDKMPIIKKPKRRRPSSNHATNQVPMKSSPRDREYFEKINEISKQTVKIKTLYSKNDDASSSGTYRQEYANDDHDNQMVQKKLLQKSNTFTKRGLPQNYDPFLSAKRQLEVLCSPDFEATSFENTLTTDSAKTPTTKTTTPLLTIPSITTPQQQQTNKTSIMSTSLTSPLTIRKASLTSISLGTPSSQRSRLGQTATAATSSGISGVVSSKNSNFRRTSSLRGSRRSPMLASRPYFAQAQRPTIQRGLSDEGPISTNFLKPEEYDEMPVRSVCQNDYAITNSPRVVRRDTSASNRKQSAHLKLNVNGSNLRDSSDERSAPNTASRFLSKTDSLAVFLKYEQDMEKLNARIQSQDKDLNEVTNTKELLAPLDKEKEVVSSISKELKDKNNTLSKQNSAKSLNKDLRNDTNDDTTKLNLMKSNNENINLTNFTNNSINNITTATTSTTTTSPITNANNNSNNNTNNSNVTNSIRLEPIMKPTTPLTEPSTPLTKVPLTPIRKPSLPSVELLNSHFPRTSTPLISKSSLPSTMKTSTPLSKPQTPSIYKTKLPTVQNYNSNLQNSVNLNSLFSSMEPKPTSSVSPFIFTKDRLQTMSDSSDYIDPKLINKCDNLPVNLASLQSHSLHDSEVSTQRNDSSISSASASSSEEGKLDPPTNTVHKHQKNQNSNQINEEQQSLPLHHTNKGNPLKNLESFDTESFHSASFSSQRSSIEGRNLLKRKIRLGRNQILYDASPEADSSCSADDEANRSSMEFDEHVDNILNNLTMKNRKNLCDTPPPSESKCSVPQPIPPPPPSAPVLFDDFDFEEFLSKFENDEKDFAIFRNCREFLVNRSLNARQTATNTLSATQSPLLDDISNQENLIKTQQQNEYSSSHFIFPPIQQNASSNTIQSSAKASSSTSFNPSKPYALSLLTSPLYPISPLSPQCSSNRKTRDCNKQHPGHHQHQNFDNESADDVYHSPIDTDDDQKKREIFISIETEHNDINSSPRAFCNMVGNPDGVIEFVDPDSNDNKFSKISDEDLIPTKRNSASKELPRNHHQDHNDHMMYQKTSQFMNAKSLIEQIQEDFRQLGEEACANLRQATKGRRSNPATNNNNNGSPDDASDDRHHPQQHLSNNNNNNHHNPESDEMSSLDSYRSRTIHSKLSADSAYGSLSRHRSSEFNIKQSRNRSLTRNEQQSGQPARYESKSNHNTHNQSYREYAQSYSRSNSEQSINGDYQYANSKDDNRQTNDVGYIMNYKRFNRSNSNINPPTESLPTIASNPSLQGSVSNSSMNSSTKMSKFCHECGSRFIIDQAKFCPECGVKRLVL